MAISKFMYIIEINSIQLIKLFLISFALSINFPEDNSSLGLLMMRCKDVNSFVNIKIIVIEETI